MAFHPDPSQPDFQGLKAILTNSRIATQNNALYQFCYQLIDNLSKLKTVTQNEITEVFNTVTTIINDLSVSGDFVTVTDQTVVFPVSRQLVAGNETEVNLTNPIQIAIDSKQRNNASIADVTGGYATDTYLAGSSITLPVAGGWTARTVYKCTFDVIKTAAGIATPIITVRMGILGTVGDAAIATITFGAGTAAVDTGVFEVYIIFRAVGGGTTAIIQVVSKLSHELAATGLTTTGAAGIAIIKATSAGFNSTTPTIIGLSFNGGTAFAGDNSLVQAELVKF